MEISNTTSVETSEFAQRSANESDLPVHKSPIGFGFIGELINDNKIMPGWEKSAEWSIKGHYPAKDGVPARLFSTKTVTACCTSVTEHLKGLFGGLGEIESGHSGLRISPEIANSLARELKPESGEVGARRHAQSNRDDAVKFTFADGACFLLRPSGTDPQVRIYAEAES